MRKIIWILLCMVLSYNARPQHFSYTDIANNEYSSDPRGLTNLNGNLLFAADDHGSLGHSHTGVAAGRELWLHNGTALVQVKDINPGLASSNPEDFVVVGGIAYFRADNGVHGVELWRTNGTPAGTYMVRDISVGAESSTPTNLVSYNGMVYFRAYTPTRGRELWKTDGTGTGTVLVRDIYPGTNSSGPLGFAVYDNHLFFSAFDADHGRELWKTDGTSAGTVLVSDIKPGPNSSGPAYMEEVNGLLLFRADHPDQLLTLMKSDGTAAGTVQVKPGAGIYMTQPFEKIKYHIAFPSNNDEIWLSDGTAANTFRLKEIIPGPGTTFIHSITRVSTTRFYFVTDDHVHGPELWTSNNTAAGTVMVADLRPGAEGSNPSNLKSIRGTLYFAANAPKSGHEPGNELWKTDGTSVGTEFVYDFFSGSYRSGDPANLTLIGNLFYLSAKEVDFRNELWVADLSESTSKPGAAMVVAAAKPASLQLFPNPATNTITLSINAGKAERLHCTIFSMDGKIVQQKTIAVTEGTNMITLETIALSSGMYTVTVKGAGLDEQVKFIRQ